MKVRCELGIEYASAEEMYFYKLVFRDPKEALIYAALNYKKIGTYALDVAVERYISKYGIASKEMKNGTR